MKNRKTITEGAQIFMLFGLNPTSLSGIHKFFLIIKKGDYKSDTKDTQKKKTQIPNIAN